MKLKTRLKAGPNSRPECEISTLNFILEVPAT